LTWRISTGQVTPNVEMISNLEDVFSSGWFSPGKYVKAFEEQFAAMHGVPHAIFVNSGTDALRISLAVLKEKYGWEDGDEVIVPALTFVATVNTILQVGLKPVFVDVDPVSFVLEGHDFLHAKTDRTRAVVPVHLFGKPADMPRIRLRADMAGLKVVEDSCESMGVGFHALWGQPADHIGYVGSYGDFGCFSTYSCHLIVTGVGGLITSHSYELDQLARSYANHGRDPYFLGGKSGDGKDPLELIQKRFLYHRVGYSCRGTEFESAVGLPQLKTLKSNVQRRTSIAQRLIDELDHCQFQFQNSLPAINRDSAHMMFPMVLKDDSIDRDRLCLSLEQQGIETRPLFPLLSQPVYQKLFPGQDERFPIAKRISSRGFYVGCHPGLTDDDVTYLISTLNASVQKDACVAA